MAHPQHTLIEKLGGKEHKILNATLAPGEQVVVALRGQWDQALVVTPNRVIIIKTGWAAGASFGSKNVSYDLRNITSVEIRMGLTQGFLEVSAGGMQGYERSNWGQGDRSAYVAPNTVPIGKRDQAKFQAAVQVIRQLAQQAQQPQAHHAPQPAAAPSIPEQIQQLAVLHKNGILTDQEFAAKKAELLSRL